jgi:hypothetical protein
MYLASLTIRDGSWKGTDTAYLNHWHEQGYLPSTPMTDEYKMHLIKNAVLPAPYLATIESTQEINKCMGSVTAGALSFKGYMEVLILAAWKYLFLPHRTTRPDVRYNIATPIDTIVTNAHDMWTAQYGNRVSDDTWSKLPSSSQEAWMSIHIAECKFILGTTNSTTRITDPSSSSRSGVP